MNGRQPHWLVRPATIRLLWLAFAAILGLSVLAGFFVRQHDHFGIESSFGFYAWYGFVTCVAMVVLAKLLGVLLKRPDDYYRRTEDTDD
jgi:hypothetical protein